jgi:hypothetical protein
MTVTVMEKKLTPLVLQYTTIHDADSSLVGYDTVLTGKCHSHFTGAFLHLHYLNSSRVAALKIWVYYPENCNRVDNQ